jgi:hypothetical protein
MVLAKANRYEQKQIVIKSKLLLAIVTNSKLILEIVIYFKSSLAIVIK